MVDENKKQSNLVEEFEKFNEDIKEYTYTLKKFKESLELLYKKIKKEED